MITRRLTQREFDELKAATPPGQPLFSSLDEACIALGHDDATKEQMRRDMESTRPIEPRAKLHLVK